jgi:hypothetical protein
MTDLRAEFEKWIDTLTYEQLAMLDETSAWDGWKASRAALKVELPATCNRALIYEHNFLTLQHEITHDEYFEVDDIKQMLTDAGISYE